MSLTAIFRFLFISAPDASWWTFFVVWVARIITVSFLLRSYIIPWALAQLSRHVRIRSMSLRSIRGLYICRGNRTVRIDRLSYTVDDGWGLVVEGLKVEVRTRDKFSFPRPTHRRSLTLERISQLERAFWNGLSSIYSVFNPLRPIIRREVVSVLRFAMRVLPRFTRHVTLEIQPFSITFPDASGATITSDLIRLHAGVQFFLRQTPPPYGPRRTEPRVSRSYPSYSIGAWKNRFRASVKRSVDTVLDETEGRATLSLRVNNVSCFTPTTNGRDTVFSIPQSIEAAVSLNFDPKDRRVDTHSLSASLGVTKCEIEMNALLALFSEIKRQASQDDDGPSSAFAFPRESQSSPIPSPLMSPTAPAPPWSSGYTQPSSPRSPFMKALSRASRLSRRPAYPPCKKLAETRCNAMISFLQGIKVDLEKVVLNIRHGTEEDENYKLSFQNIALFAGLSRPWVQPLHRRWFGKGSRSAEIFDPDVYCVSLSAGPLKFDRYTSHHHLRLLAMELFDFQTLTTQFPSPWLVPSPFLGGDPNGPLLVVSTTIGNIQLTEQMHYLASMVERMQSKSRPAQAPSSSSGFFAVPRLAISVHCGTISARLVLPSAGAVTRAIEARTDGFVVSCHSHYKTRIRYTGHGDLDALPLQLSLAVNVVLEPVFIRIRSRFSQKHLSSTTTSDPDFLEDPVLVSLEQVSVAAQCSALCDIRDDTQNIASVDTSTFIADVSCICDALCVELWHSLVVEGVVQTISALPSRPKPHRARASRPLLEHLPSGLSASLCLGRTVMFVTQPDINPKEDMEISRGIAIRAEQTLLQYCSMQLQHRSRFGDLRTRSEGRSKLYLPEEQLSRALSAARSSPTLPTASIMFGVTDLSMRSALATQFAADDPTMAEYDNPDLTHREFLRLRGIETEALFSTSEPDSSICDALIRVHPNHVPRAPTMTVNCKGKMDTLQVYCGLPSERAALRFDALRIDLAPESPPKLYIHRTTGWVFVRTPLSPWEDGTVRGKWKEFAFLRKWQISMTASPDSPLLAVNGASARIRVPFGYITADLIQDIGVSVKAGRHLFHLLKEGVFRDFPTPEAEGPKRVPPLSISISHFCVEVEDDPFEQKLDRAIKVGQLANKARLEREKAFDAKVATILEEDRPSYPGAAYEYEFSAEHTVSIAEARSRLDEVHSIDWIMRVDMCRQDDILKEDHLMKNFLDSEAASSHSAPYLRIPSIVEVASSSHAPPLFRAMATGLSISTSAPSFPANSLGDFLYSQGDLPRDTQFSLLIPMHMKLTLASLRVNLRDYTIPLIDVPAHYSNRGLPALEFTSDLVIAEEMGSDLSVQWVDCPISDANDGIYGAASLSLSIPKTIMPVKTYASPDILVSTPAVTTVGWGVSYGPATQDLMRVLDTLTSAPRDSSPGLGFWDKIRLVFHWSIRASFKGEVRLHMKGLRDPRDVAGTGAGFVLSWQGHTKLLLGRPNDDREAVQVISDIMMIAVPSFEFDVETGRTVPAKHRPFKKVCAKVTSGVRFGVGFAFERTCGAECRSCAGTPFQRRCRFFDFRPHYGVRLERKDSQPLQGAADDSFHGFRSDFIHLSISLTSSVRPSKATTPRPSSLYLTPLVFTHFWNWWSLFDGVMSIPIRQGTYYPQRMISPKFGRHLATLKYRISLKPLTIMHGYIDDGRETWLNGVTPWVGVKALLDEFQVDMHQRDQETTVQATDESAPKIVRHKPFYAAEVVMKGLDLRAIVATFPEPLKKAIPVNSLPPGSNYRTRNNLTETPLTSTWYDADDFIELDWNPNASPVLFVLPVVSCPHFMFFKRNLALLELPSQSSKFGNEDTHICLLGKEPSVPDTQRALAQQRVNDLQELLDQEDTSIPKKITLLEQYISRLDDPELPSGAQDNTHAYQIPSDTVSPDEWAEFNNVYQIHCPKISLDSAVRDIMMQYYYCSRDRRGLEYHLATRAVTFILDQAKAAIAVKPEAKHILIGDRADSDESFEDLDSETSSIVDPLHGWSEGVSLSKGHCCLLLKPQIILQNREKEAESCVVTALQAKLQSFSIMDDANAKDPVSGKVMSRTFTLLSGLQTFAPTAVSRDYGCVPLEVLIDFRCESDDFDRLVPQTDATFHYDKFNRLRLRNNVTSVVSKPGGRLGTTHLQDQTDLVKVTIPKFTVTASDRHFKTISNIVSKLLLFSDATHKTRIDKLETLLFTYDFTDLTSAAKVIEDLQTRLREGLAIATLAGERINYERRVEVMELLRLKAHIYLLSDELNLIFDAIKLAQDRFDDSTDRKSALLLNTSSSEISWNMLDENREMLAKLVVQDIDYYWLSRQDSSTVNNLTVGNLQAFDGSKDAVWAEILSKYDDPPNHPLLRRRLFLVSDWSLLPPVGGITIYENFDLSLHPMRLQIDAKVGRRIMEYLWPARRTRNISDDTIADSLDAQQRKMLPPARTSLDTPRALGHSKQASEPEIAKLAPPTGLRRLGTSRSFTNLREAASSRPQPLRAPTLSRTRSSTALGREAQVADSERRVKNNKADIVEEPKQRGDAAEMRTRSSQKTFVLVRISSLHVLLSMMKEESFVCHEARITTRDLEYRNQTWSFEELVDQFIPSDTSWKGWVKMAFQQPLVPVLPVARELLKKTKLIPNSRTQTGADARPGFPSRSRTHLLTGTEAASARTSISDRTRSPSPSRGWRRTSKRPLEPSGKLILDAPFTSEPDVEPPKPTRNRVLSLLRRSDKPSRSNSSAAGASSAALRKSGDSGR
ncbi:hypothetical protein BDZ89DRAFT_1056032 [Hymenopellis radicata]|nr:hypothetical protein BDZ89DRAFT_1056032 [Hymenopellis radicata]